MKDMKGNAAGVVVAERLSHAAQREQDRMGVKENEASVVPAEHLQQQWFFLTFMTFMYFMVNLWLGARR